MRWERWAIFSTWGYLGACVLLDGFGTGWWHWMWVIATAVMVIAFFAAEEWRSAEAARARRSWSENTPRVIGEYRLPRRSAGTVPLEGPVPSWRGRDPWANQ